MELAPKVSSRRPSSTGADGRLGRTGLCNDARRRSAPPRPFDLRGGEADAVPVEPDRRGGLAIDADQVIGSHAIDALLEELGDGRAVLDFDGSAKPAPIQHASSLVYDWRESMPAVIPVLAFIFATG